MLVFSIITDGIWLGQMITFYRYCSYYLIVDLITIYIYLLFMVSHIFFVNGCSGRLLSIVYFSYYYV